MKPEEAKVVVKGLEEGASLGLEQVVGLDLETLRGMKKWKELKSDYLYGPYLVIFVICAILQGALIVINHLFGVEPPGIDIFDIILLIVNPLIVGIMAFLLVIYPLSYVFRRWPFIRFAGAVLAMLIGILVVVFLGVIAYVPGFIAFSALIVVYEIHGMKNDSLNKITGWGWPVLLFLFATAIPILFLLILLRGGRVFESIMILSLWYLNLVLLPAGIVMSIFFHNPRKAVKIALFLVVFQYTVNMYLLNVFDISLFDLVKMAIGIPDSGGMNFLDAPLFVLQNIPGFAAIISILNHIGDSINHVTFKNNEDDAAASAKGGNSGSLGSQSVPLNPKMTYKETKKEYKRMKAVWRQQKRTANKMRKMERQAEKARIRAEKEAFQRRLRDLQHKRRVDEVNTLVRNVVALPGAVIKHGKTVVKERNDLRAREAASFKEIDQDGIFYFDILKTRNSKYQRYVVGWCLILAMVCYLAFLASSQVLQMIFQGIALLQLKWETFTFGFFHGDVIPAGLSGWSLDSSIQSLAQYAIAFIAALPGLIWAFRKFKKKVVFIACHSEDEDARKQLKNILEKAKAEVVEVKPGERIYFDEMRYRHSEIQPPPDQEMEKEKKIEAFLTKRVCKTDTVIYVYNATRQLGDHWMWLPLITAAKYHRRVLIVNGRPGQDVNTVNEFAKHVRDEIKTEEEMRKKDVKRWKPWKQDIRVAEPISIVESLR